MKEANYSSHLFGCLRDRGKISRGCQDCFYSTLCRGGLKCLSYALKGDPFKADPGCWCISKDPQAARLEGVPIQDRCTGNPLSRADHEISRQTPKHVL